MNKYWKIILPVIFALAIIFGLGQRKLDPYLNSQKTTFYFQHLPATGDKSLQDFFNESEQIRGSQPQTATVAFLAAGDIMLSRNVAGTVQKSGDVDLPFKKMAETLNSTSFNFANLESPISGSNYFNPSGSMVFNAPAQYTRGLSDYNFKIVNLANNHTFDQGLKGLEYTRSFLDSLGIQHIGTGDSLDEAWQPAIITANGIKICFVGASYASVNDNGKTTNPYVARIENIDRLKSAVTTARSECDFVVVTMHAGTEYTRTPNKMQTDFAHAAIDDGADMVIGAHPHWIQTIEKYQGKYIFYSLGNFIFDQEWSQDTKEGLTLKIQISNPKLENAIAPNAASITDLQGPRQPAHLDSVELIPVIIENYSTPRPATPEEAKNILNKIGETEKILY